MLRQKVPFPEKWAVVSIAVIAIIAAIIFAVLMYYHIYPQHYQERNNPFCP